MTRQENLHARKTGSPLKFLLVPRARSLFETYQMTNIYEVKPGKVQLMLFHRELGKIGGLCTKPNGQYLLASPAQETIGSSRLLELDFELRHRSGGSPFWWKQWCHYTGMKSWCK